VLYEKPFVAERKQRENACIESVYRRRARRDGVHSEGVHSEGVYSERKALLIAERKQRVTAERTHFASNALNAVTALAGAHFTCLTATQVQILTRAHNLCAGR
jgi:hypothetical protein